MAKKKKMQVKKKNKTDMYSATYDFESSPVEWNVSNKRGGNKQYQHFLKKKRHMGKW